MPETVSLDELTLVEVPIPTSPALVMRRRSTQETAALALPLAALENENIPSFVPILTSPAN